MFFLTSKTHPVYVKINIYARPKIIYRKPPRGGGWFKRELKFLGLFLGLISFSNFILTNNISALFVPTLSASVDQANLQVNGNQVINSTDQTKEIPLRLNVETNNKTGYTATISSSSENTSLVNSNPASTNQISSISSNLNLSDFSANTWGFKLNSSTSYNPIPALSTPIGVLQTTDKTNGLDSNIIKVGMKLSQNLESGTYSNTLVFSFISNPYTPKAVMIKGLDFQGRLARFDPSPSHVNGHPELPTYPNLVHIKRERNASSVPISAINLEADNSEAEIKAWYDSATKTVYWYSASEKVYLNPDCTNMFAYFTGMTDVDLSSFDTSEVESMNAMFYFNFALEKLNVSGFDTSHVKNMSAMFDNLTSLKELDITNFNTSNVETMQYMFYNLNKVKTLDVSHFDTRNVKNMEGVFAWMTSLESLNLSNFNTSKVTTMRDMFAWMTSLESLNLSNFNTSKVTTMRDMFAATTTLKSLDLSSFDTRNVVDMRSMFYYVISLKTLNVSSFNTENVENMSNMFARTDSLEELDLSSFKTPKVKAFRAMFYTEDPDKNVMRRIYASADFDISTAVASHATDPQANIDIFWQMKNLVGGNGTRSSNIPLAGIYLLKIDRPGVPGLFTRKT